MNTFSLTTALLAAWLMIAPSICTLNGAESVAPSKTKAPVILVRSGWQTVNIGDIAHTPGLLSLLETYLPDARVIVWGHHLENGVEENLKAHFPRVRFVHGEPLEAGARVDWNSLSPEVRQAYREADLLIHNSSPAIHRTPDFEAWRKLTGKPYGYYGVTMDSKSLFAQITERNQPIGPDTKDLLEGAAFLFFRDSRSLNDARQMGVHATVMEFAPDAVFGVRQYDTARAETWLHENGLKDKQFICVIARTRFVPYHVIQNRPPSSNEQKRVAYNGEHMEADLGKIRDAITRWVRQTKLKVALVPEMTFEVDLHKTQILDRLPEDVKPYVVWKNTYWMPDEAAAVYSKAIALLSMECHSPIIADDAGTPALYVSAPTETYKKYMWGDIGLGKWMFEIDETSGKEIAEALIQIQRDPRAASARLKNAMDFVSKRQKETMAIVARSLPNNTSATSAPLAGSDRFPKPEPEKFLAEYKILQPDGSIYRRPKEDWEGARKLVASDPAWAAWLKEKQTTVDAWMARNRDRATWQAGRAHDFVSPIDGARLIWTEDIPGEQVKILRSKTGAEVEVTPAIFDAWVDQFRKAHVKMIAEAACLYRLTGDKRYADWAAGQLDFYANNLESWPLRKSSGGETSRLGVLAFNDAIMLTSMAGAARLLSDWAEPQRRQLWFDKLFKPEVEMLESLPGSIHNQRLWGLVARIQVALLYNDEAMWRRAVDDPKSGFRAQVRNGVTSEYLWFEQSMNYNDFVLQAFLPVFEWTALAGRQDRLRQEAAIVENMMLATMLYRFPDNTLPNPADSTRIYSAPSPRLETSYRYFPTRIGLAAAMETRSWDTLVDPPAAIAPLKPCTLPEVTSYNMESSRFALLKQGPWQVFFHYGQAANSHTQAEALNWSAYYEKTPVSTDPGTVNYGSKLYKGYYTRGLNHNVPLVDGEGEGRANPGRLIEFDPAGANVTAEQPEYQQNASARRTLHIDGNKLIEETTVTSKNKTPSKLGLVLHLKGKPLLSSAFQEVKNFADGRPEPFKQWEKVQAATFQDRAQVDVTFASGLVLSVTFSAPGKFTLYQGLSPELPPEKRAGFYLETEGTSATFTTTLAPK